VIQSGVTFDQISWVDPTPDCRSREEESHSTSVLDHVTAEPSRCKNGSTTDKTAGECGSVRSLETRSRRRPGYRLLAGDDAEAGQHRPRLASHRSAST
jgi:hypothetical protein